MSRQVDLLEFSFFLPWRGVAEPEALFAALTAAFPDARPTRFGNADPPPFRVGESLDEFLAMWRDKADGGWLQWRGSGACLSANASYPFWPAEAGVTSTQVQLTLEAGRAGPADRLAPAFDAAARGLGAYAATAYLVRNHFVTRSGVVNWQMGVSETSPIVRPWWLGLPEERPALLWLGAQYGEPFRLAGAVAGPWPLLLDLSGDGAAEAEAMYGALPRELFRTKVSRGEHAPAALLPEVG
jgi:hypothetical protein